MGSYGIYNQWIRGGVMRLVRGIFEHRDRSQMGTHTPRPEKRAVQRSTG